MKRLTWKDLDYVVPMNRAEMKFVMECIRQRKHGASKEVLNKFEKVFHQIESRQKQLKRWLKSLAAIFLFSFGVSASENSDYFMHPMATAGVTAITYSICRHYEGSKLTCAVLSASTAITVGVWKEAYDGDNNSTSEHAKDMGLNVAGVAIALPLLMVGF